MSFAQGLKEALAQGEFLAFNVVGSLHVACGLDAGAAFEGPPPRALVGALVWLFCPMEASHV